MVEYKEGFETWEEVISNFLLDRLNKQHEKLLSAKDKKKPLEKQGIIIQIKNKLDNFKENEEYIKLRDRKNTGSDKQEALEFQKSLYFDLVDFARINNIDLSNLVNEYSEKFNKLKESHQVENWIDQKAPNAHKVRFSTNVAKLTHPSIKGASSFFIKYSEDNGNYITTSTLKKSNIDDSVDNAADTPIINFLKLSLKNKQLSEFISDKDKSPFTWITDDSSRLDSWINLFSQSFKTKEMSSHFLSKQVYFPIDTNEYHLLSNVKSSSLAHAVYSKVTMYYERDKGKYKAESIIRYPLRAKVAVTASSKAHTNVSPLNVKRDGYLHLLCSQPPIWQSQIKPPLYKESLFYAMPYNYAIKENIDYLRDFLLRFESIDLSIKNPKRMKYLERWIENIIDEIFVYVATLQNLKSAWSRTDDIKLKKEHQALLDPYRDDLEFQEFFTSNDWQNTVCIDFAEWLNNKLRGKDKKFTPQKEHTKLWKKLIKDELRNFVEDVTFDVKKKLEEKK